MARRKGSAFLHALLRRLPVLVSLAAALAPLPAAADIKGFMEFDFGKTQVKSTDPTGLATSSSSTLFLQRYNIDLTKNLYPLLFLEAGGVFENSLADSKAGGVDSSGSATQISPFATLAWQDHTFPVNLGYQRREERAESNGVASSTQIMESYSANLGWRPLELPPWNIAYLRTNRYDQDRAFTDSSTDSFQWSTSYNPVSRADFTYQGSYLRDVDHITQSENDFTVHSGRASYADQFLDHRLSLASSYNLSASTSTFLSAGSGVSLTPVPALNGALFAVTSPTSQVRVDSGQLTASAGAFNVNIVSAAPLLPGTQDNFGLDFARPVAVNTLYLPVVSGAFPRPSNLSRIAGLFPWSLYTSDDGVTWTLSQTVSAPSFGPDPSGASNSVGFILHLAPVTKRFLKVVVTPVQQSALLPLLPIADIDPSSVSIAGLQAFSVLARGASTTSKALTGSYTLSGSARLLDNPNLNYDMNFSLNHSSVDGNSSVNYYLSNGVSVSKRFSEIFSGMARVSINNGRTQGSQPTNSLSGSAALTATPLPTLSHSLVFSSQIGYTGNQKISSNSFFINNTAQLYRGAALGLSGGFSSATDDSGRTSDSTILITGLTLTPNKSVSLDASYGQTSSKADGGGRPEASNTVRTVSSSVTYRPFEAVYLSGRWSLLAQTGQPVFTTQSYVVNWSPFAGGALQLNISYNETLSLPSNSQGRGITTGVQWAIRSGMSLDASYSYARNNDPLAGTSSVNSISTVLRIAM